VRCALPPTGKHVTDAAGVPPCESNTRFHSQPGTHTSTVRRSETADAKAHPAQNPRKTTTDAAGVPPCEYNTRFHSQPGTHTSTVNRSETAGAKAHLAQNPSEDNHRCGWSATLRTQHQVPFATWHKYVNGQPQGHGWKEEDVHKPGLFTLREQARKLNKMTAERKRPGEI
jgi:hypothetical protein